MWGIHPIYIYYWRPSSNWSRIPPFTILPSRVIAWSKGDAVHLRIRLGEVVLEFRWSVETWSVSTSGEDMCLWRFDMNMCWNMRTYMKRCVWEDTYTFRFDLNNHEKYTALLFHCRYFSVIIANSFHQNPAWSNYLTGYVFSTCNPTYLVCHFLHIRLPSQWTQLATNFFNSNEPAEAAQKEACEDRTISHTESQEPRLGPSESLCHRLSLLATRHSLCALLCPRHSLRALLCPSSSSSSLS